MKRFKNYILKDAKGNIIAQGRYNKVSTVCYHRYVYSHIFDDVLYTDGTYINKNGNKID